MDMFGLQNKLPDTGSYRHLLLVNLKKEHRAFWKKKKMKLMKFWLLEWHSWLDLEKRNGTFTHNQKPITSVTHYHRPTKERYGWNANGYSYFDGFYVGLILSLPNKRISNWDYLTSETIRKPIYLRLLTEQRIYGPVSYMNWYWFHGNWPKQISQFDY